VKGVAGEQLYMSGTLHPAAVVNEYATFLLRTQTPKGRMQAFVKALDSADVNERIRAIENIANARDKDALTELKRLVDDGSFLSRSPEEMHAFLKAIALIGGSQARDFIDKQANRTTGVFRRRAGEEIRASAQHILKNLPRGE
jgi:HEAT repeat protein